MRRLQSDASVGEKPREGSLKPQKDGARTYITVWSWNVTCRLVAFNAGGRAQHRVAEPSGRNMVYCFRKKGPVEISGPQARHCGNGISAARGKESWQAGH